MTKQSQTVVFGNGTAGRGMKLSTIMVVFILLVSCGNWGWESIETDNEERLNIFGIISLDDSLESFIIVHKTLDTAGPIDMAVGSDTIYYEVGQRWDEEFEQAVPDTFWYDPPLIYTKYENQYLVKDAVVIVSDATQDYLFERAPNDNNEERYWGYSGVFSDPAVYLNLDGRFSPEPDTDYTLSVVSESGLSATGFTHTPPIPQIKTSLLPDTVSIRSLFSLEWEYAGDLVSTVATGATWDYLDTWICGVEQWNSLQRGDTTWVSEIPTYCLEAGFEQDENATMGFELRLRFLDDNYNDYFIASGEVGEISNILLGEGGIAEGYGIENGFGVFGSLSADWIQRTAKP